MEKTTKTTLIDDIENRLDDFFGAQPPASSPSSLEKLKSAILSIDWEITDGCLADLVRESEALMPSFQEDPVSLALLRMLAALGRYIRKRKAQAHQDAIKRVMSVYASLELLVENNNLEEKQKRTIVAKEIQAFKKLKQQIEAQQAPRKTKTSSPGPTAPPDTAAPGDLHFRQAMQEMEQRLTSEVKALKDQLAALQKDLNRLRKG